MKKAAAFLLAALLLSGCTGKQKEMDQAIHLRTKLLAAGRCLFDADITADYGDRIHSFSLECEADGTGSVHFSVTKPASISGIEGIVDAESGKLTFGDTVLYFPLLADDQLSPVCAPWVLVKTLRAGYITSAGKDGSFSRIRIDDSYADDAMQLDIWLDESEIPVRADIAYKDRRILSVDVNNFRME